MNRKLIVFQISGILIIFLIFYFSFKFIFNAIDKYNISTIKKQIIFSLSDELAEGNYFKLGYIFSKLEREGIISSAELIEINNKEKNIIYKSSSKDFNDYLDKISCNSTKSNDLIRRINNETILVTHLPYNFKENKCNILLIKYKPSKEIKNLYFKNIILFVIFLLSAIIIMLVFTNLFHKKYSKFELEKQRILYEKEAEIGRISLQVAHDIRSPLASLESGLKDIDIPEDNAALIKQSTERIRAIADDLLRKYRRNPKVDNLEGKKEEDIKYTEKTCDLTEIIKKIILEKKAVYKDIEFKVDTPNEKIEIKTDANEIGRMVSNLINNSVEAMAGDKSQIRVYNRGNKNITIRLRKEEDKAVIIIKDNGKGIPKEIIKRLGEKGFSVGKENGNGLGLWHAKTLTESLGGSLEISSETNLGTEIRIILPVLTTNSIIPVVLIDDDPLVRKNWEIKSRKNKINLKTYANPTDFIETSHNYPKETQIYLDSELGSDIKGEEIAKEIYERGFNNIYIETGYSKDKFKGNKYIKDIISKEPPF